MKIRSGDEVIVLQGRDKGKKGKVEKAFTKKGTLIVAGINILKKNVKKSGNTPGGIIEKNAPLNLAKVALVCPKCNQPTKGIFKQSGGKKERICKKCKQII